ncbi:FUSC family protein [Nguyenibacter sp. L1]|nr:FUSC family protein [Nguyenibacter sp. L1]WRH89435.1 FUSC family protein [Nguyenibacter sp. L1]
MDLPRRLWALFAEDARWQDIRGRAAFCARTFAAIALALFCSFLFQLESPLSSVTTVMIVANPTVGALMSKSIWRVIGTVLGAAIAVAMMAVLAQSPVLYMMVLAVVVAFACLVATFLRLFRAYAAVLTGYTIVIVAAPAYADPNGIFVSALSRLSAVTVGVVATAVVFLVTTMRRPENVAAQIAQIVRDTVDHAMAYHNFRRGVAGAEAAPLSVTGEFRSLPTPLYDRRGVLMSRIGALISAVEYAATDTYEIRRRIGALRVGLSGLAGVVATYHPLWSSMEVTAPAMERLHAHLAGLMEQILAIVGRPGWMEDIRPIRALIAAARAHLTQAERNEADIAVLAAIDNLHDVLSQLDGVLLYLSAEHAPRHARLRWFLDWPTALRNGARGGVITLLAGLMWYVLHWSAGPMLMLYVVAASSLVSTTPSASRASVLMAGGTLLSIPAGIACHMLVLPRIDGFPLLLGALCLFLLPGVWMQFSPRWGIGAFGYSVFFTALLDVANPIRYHDLSLTNNWLTFAVACVLLVLGFRVVLPPDDRLDAARLVASIGRGVRRLALVLPETPGAWVTWEGVQIQKIMRLAMRLSLCMAVRERNAYTDAALGAVALGRLVVRARRIAALPVLDDADRASLRAALDGFARLRDDPEGTARGLADGAQAMLSRAAGHADAGYALQARRAAACLQQAAYILRAVPGFFHRHGPLQLDPGVAGAALPLSAMPVRAGAEG